jgi:iron complex outermembrane receptor protein
MTLSTNKIRNYTAYYEKYDNMNDWNYLGQHQVEFANTDILMSPSLVGMAGVTFKPFASSAKSLDSIYLSMNGKYVGKQFYDNTSSDERAIPAYFVADLSLGYEPFSGLTLSLHVNNLFNRMYYADAWLWRAYFQEEDLYYKEVGVYPQAPLNMMFKASWRF